MSTVEDGSVTRSSVISFVNMALKSMRLTHSINTCYREWLPVLGVKLNRVILKDRPMFSHING